jgi:hypothetical protein
VISVTFVLIDYKRLKTSDLSNQSLKWNTSHLQRLKDKSTCKKSCLLTTKVFWTSIWSKECTLTNVETIINHSHHYKTVLSRSYHRCYETHLLTV